MRAEGKDQLFATLDVTAHGGRLPCGLGVLFIDTVGFIQNIPTDLVASFKATLEDAIYSVSEFECIYILISEKVELGNE